jgi:hypothetical protein
MEKELVCSARKFSCPQVTSSRRASPVLTITTATGATATIGPTEACGTKWRDTLTRDTFTGNAALMMQKILQLENENRRLRQDDLGSKILRMHDLCLTGQSTITGQCSQSTITGQSTIVMPLVFSRLQATACQRTRRTRACRTQ